MERWQQERKGGLLVKIRYVKPHTECIGFSDVDVISTSLVIPPIIPKDDPDLTDDDVYEV